MLNFSFNSKTSKHMMFTHKVPQLTKKFLFSTFMCPKPNWNLRHKHCNHWSFYPWSNIVKFEKITYLKSIFFLSKCYPSLDFTPSGKYGGGRRNLNWGVLSFPNLRSYSHGEDEQCTVNLICFFFLQSYHHLRFVSQFKLYLIDLALHSSWTSKRAVPFFLYTRRDKVIRM